MGHPHVPAAKRRAVVSTSATARQDGEFVRRRGFTPTGLETFGRTAVDLTWARGRKSDIVAEMAVREHGWSSSAGLSGRLSTRFIALHPLGEGEFGIVYRAFDCETQSNVALKIIKDDDPGRVLALKNEYRSLAGLRHRNLVEFHDLFIDDLITCISMELIEGAPITEGIQAMLRESGGDITDDRAQDKVLDAASQLVNGLNVLHQAGKAHRDVKPSNVLLARDGRVVLLDFGLAAPLVENHRRPELAGTLAYMAPEQRMGQFSRASDLYAAGAVLFEAITGRAVKTRADAEWRQRQVDEGLPWLPDRLAAILCALMARKSSDRPDATAIARLLGAHLDSDPLLVAPVITRTKLVGREQEIEQAYRALAASSGVPVTVRVDGPPGIGKTSLVEAVLQRLEGVTIIRARCRPSDSVPFSALDEVIDELCEHVLTPQDFAGLSVPTTHLRCLAQMFPVLEIHVPATTDVDLGAVEPSVIRADAIEALRHVLRRVTDRMRLLLFLDDVQWLDSDGSRLLSELMAGASPLPLAIVIVHRTVDAPLEVVTRLDEGHSRSGLDRGVALTLGPLADGATALLFEEMIAEHRPAADLASLVAECGGNPLLAVQLAHRLREPTDERIRASLDNVLQRSFGALLEPERLLLDLVAAVSRPVTLSALVAASGTGTLGIRALRRLCDVKLLTSHRSDEVWVAPFHERVRESLRAWSPPERRRRAHRYWLTATAAAVDVDPQQLLEHALGADDHVTAARMALAAGDRASDGLSFERAAAFFGLALELGAADRPRGRVLADKARALANAGRGAEAAVAYLQSAEVHDEANALLLRRAAAEQYLQSGRHQDGKSLMSSVLRAYGVRVPSTDLGAILMSLWRRARIHILPMRRRRRPATTREVARLDALWAASTSLSMMNFPVADALGLQHHLEARYLADVSRSSRALGYEASFQAALGWPLMRPKVFRLLAEQAQLAAQSSDPFDRAWVCSARGSAAWLSGDWLRAAEDCDRAIHILRRECRGAGYYVALFEAYRLSALAYLGRFQEVVDRIDEGLRDALRRDDLFAANNFRLADRGLARLALGQDAEVERHLAEASVTWPQDSFHTQAFYAVQARVQLALYRGDYAVAARELDEAWPKLRRAQYLRLAMPRIELLALRARVAVCRAPRSSQVLARCVTQLGREHIMIGPAYADLLREDGADDRLSRQRAAQAFERLSMPAHAAAARATELSVERALWRRGALSP